jgi:hypothetical protein
MLNSLARYSAKKHAEKRAAGAYARVSIEKTAKRSGDWECRTASAPRFVKERVAARSASKRYGITGATGAFTVMGVTSKGAAEEMERRSFRVRIHYPSAAKLGVKSWARIARKRRLHPKTIAAMRDIRVGNVVRADSIEELFASLNAED